VKNLPLNFYNTVNDRIFWNSFWNAINMATVDYSTYTKRFRMFDDFLLQLPYRLILNWTVPTKDVNKKYNVSLIESVIDNEKSENNKPSDINLKSESAFLTSLFIKSINYKRQSYPEIIISKAKQCYGSIYEPKASKKNFYKICAFLYWI